MMHEEKSIKDYDATVVDLLTNSRAIQFLTDFHRDEQILSEIKGYAAEFRSILFDDPDVGPERVLISEKIFKEELAKCLDKTPRDPFHYYLKDNFLNHIRIALYNHIG